MKKTKISEFLIRRKDSIIIEDNLKYKRLTIKGKNQGVFLRDEEIGINIGTKKQFIAKSEQFILSKIDAMNGAFGIIPKSIDEAIITGNFWTYDVNTDMVIAEWFNLFVSLPSFTKLCISLSSGTTHRKYLDEDKFSNFELFLPSIDEQKDIISNFKLNKEQSDIALIALAEQEKCISNLRQSILQQAIEGKLVPQHSNDESASVLLEKIKAEKEQLIKEKKIKKQKDLPPIKDEEKPFELPQGWEWCRLGDVSTIKGGKRLPKGDILVDCVTEHIYIRVTDMKNNTISDDDIRYITKATFEQISKYTISKDDLYIVIVGSTIGKVGQVPAKFHNMNLTENAAKIIHYQVEKNFLLLALQSGYLQIQFIDKTNQVGQPKLALERIEGCNLPLPPLAEQQRIVEKVDSLMALCDELEQEVKTAKKYASQLMEAVLQEAFTEDTPTLNDRNSNIVEFPTKKVSEKDTLLALAARGNMKQKTWEKIVDSVMDDEE